MPWRTLLVLGGAGSGHQEYAESLLAGAERPRRIGRAEPADPAGLAGTLTAAAPDETLLVPSLADWLPHPAAGTSAAGDPGGPASDPDGPASADPPGSLDGPRSADPATVALAAALHDCPARLVLVSDELGLGGPPPTAADPGRTGALSTLNRAVAGAVDAVVLVVAGQPAWLKGGPSPIPAPVLTAPVDPPTAAPDLARLSLPLPDEEASQGATAQLAGLGAVSLGALAPVVRFAAGAQRRAVPEPWRQIRVLVLLGDHAGAAAAGAPGSARRAASLRAGTSPLARLAGAAGARVQLVETATAAPIEDQPAMPEEQVDPAIGYGWRLAQQAVDEGDDLLVLGAIGDGAETAAAAVTAVLAPNTEPAGLLARVRTEPGRIDDTAWMHRCAAVRDAVRRARSGSRTTGRAVLAELGGPDLATATGVLLGAAARRTPVLLDGPVGAAAALAARNLASPARFWCLLPDHGRHPTVTAVAEALGLTPWLDLGLELGEGATALAALPLVQLALALAGTRLDAPDPEPVGRS
jgi:nicotinate-nucleotide--dimethylbenzimidazole phosphoribosyltransferase